MCCLDNVFEQDFSKVVDTNQYYFGQEKDENEGAFLREFNFDLISNDSLQAANDSSQKVSSKDVNEIYNLDMQTPKSPCNDGKSTNFEARSNGIWI